jgi:type IV secretory pathway TraG/TraD family ATPase VirD4
MDQVLKLAETRGRQPVRTFGIRANDRLQHIYVIGQTGTGKSTLLLQMMLQDIKAGQGFCLIDPHGDVVKEIAKLKPDGLIEWNVADPNCPYGYNPLSYVQPEYRPLIASGLISALKKQWADAWGPRMEHLLRFTLLALLDNQRSTLEDIMRLFLDKAFQQEIIENASDPIVRRFWKQEYPAMSFKNGADGVAPIANKLSALLAHPIVRKSICTPKEPLRFRRIMDEGKILVINLSKGRLGADIANVLGGLIVANLANAAYSRENVPEIDRKPFFLYIDEFHSFTTEALADMLSELRKYGLGMVLAHQHTSQLDRTVFEAILGNVGTLMVFRVGAYDATLLAKHLAADVPSSRDLSNLPNYEMYTRLLINGGQSKPFSARTWGQGQAFVGHAEATALR